MFEFHLIVTADGRLKIRTEPSVLAFLLGDGRTYTQGYEHEFDKYGNLLGFARITLAN